MFAITDKSGIKSILFENLDDLFSEYFDFLNYNNITISHDLILKNIKEKGFFDFIINDHIYYIIKTSIEFNKN